LLLRPVAQARSRRARQPRNYFVKETLIERAPPLRAPPLLDKAWEMLLDALGF
jgi:hypothetical protein